MSVPRQVALAMTWEELEAAGLCDCGRELAGHPALGRPKPRRVHVVPAVQALGLVLEAYRFARLRHPAIDVKPVLLVFRRDLPHPTTFDVFEPCLPREGRVDLEEAVVSRLAGDADRHLDDAEAHIQLVEQEAVTPLDVARGRIRSELRLSRVLHMGRRSGVPQDKRRQRRDG